MNANIFAKANQIIKNSTDAYFGVIDENGCPSVSTVTVIKPENIFDVCFSTGLRSNKVNRLQKDNRASICFHAGGDNITLVGTAEILTDQETKNKYWMGWTDHFPGGETDPDYCIIKLTVKRASLWIDSEDAAFTVDKLMTIQSYCGLLCDGCTYKESHGCGGCVETKGNPFHGECPIAKCCVGKGYLHCGECADMPCEQLRQYSYDDAEHGDKPPGARLTICHAWAMRGKSK